MCLGREAYACLLGESKRKKKDTPEDARESLKAPFEIKRKKKNMKSRTKQQLLNQAGEEFGPRWSLIARKKEVHLK